jgi:hypothetical protein
MTKKVDPETSPRASTWPVKPIDKTKKVDPETSPTTYIYDEKCFSRNFPYGPYMYFTASIYI